MESYHIPIRYDYERDGPCMACHQAKIVQILKTNGFKIGRIPTYGHPTNCETLHKPYQKDEKLSIDTSFHIYQKIKELETLIEKYRQEFSKD